jgi:hypothetical protein
MKIICSTCKIFLGEQKPFSDPSEISAKCVSCLDKEKEEARKARLIPKLEKEREVTFESGWKGILSIAGKETEELSLWDMIVAGKKFSCSEKERDELKGYLNRIAEDEVDVTFLHSISCKIERLDGRRKRKQSPPVEEKKPESIHYNCTVKIPKHCVLSMFNDKADRMEKVAEILAKGAYKIYQEECRKAAQNGDKSMKTVE